MKTHQQALSMGDCNAVDNPYILSLQECPFPTMTNGSLLKHVSTEGLHAVSLKMDGDQNVASLKALCK